MHKATAALQQMDNRSVPRSRSLPMSASTLKSAPAALLSAAEVEAPTRTCAIRSILAKTKKKRRGTRNICTAGTIPAKGSAQIPRVTTNPPRHRLALTTPGRLLPRPRVVRASDLPAAPNPRRPRAGNRSGAVFLSTHRRSAFLPHFHHFWAGFIHFQHSYFVVAYRNDAANLRDAIEHFQ